MNFRQLIKLDNIRAKYKRYCSCGHSIVFPKSSRVSKTICTWCGNWIYKSDIEEFKDKYRRKEREIKNEIE